MKFAVIDIGASSIRGDIYETSGGRPVRLFSAKSTARLTAFRRDGLLSAEGAALLTGVLAGFLRELAARGVGLPSVYPFATASLRGLRNADEVIRAVRGATGLSIRLLPGEEEAGMVFAAARALLPGLRDGTIADIGGGSTEIIRFRGGLTEHFASLPLGTLTTGKQAQAAGLNEAAHIRAELDALPWLREAPGAAFVTGGTAKNLAAVHRKWKGIGGAMPDVYELPVADLAYIFGGMDGALRAELLSRVPSDRAATLPRGALILREVFSEYGSVAVLSCGVREGFAASLGVTG